MSAVYPIPCCTCVYIILLLIFTSLYLWTEEFITAGVNIRHEFWMDTPSISSTQEYVGAIQISMHVYAHAHIWQNRIYIAPVCLRVSIRYAVHLCYLANLHATLLAVEMQR